MDQEGDRTQELRRTASEAEGNGRRASPGPPVPPVDLAASELYINRELSSLAFQRRVLEEADDPRHPLLERLRFLAIVGSNLDEFFMVRVAGLQQQIAAGVLEVSADGLTPAEQLAAARKEALAIMAAARQCLGSLQGGLVAAGIHLKEYSAVRRKRRKAVDAYFHEVVFPVLTPLAFDPGRPFPHISNLSLNLAVSVRDAAGDVHFARVKIPGTLPRLVPLKRSSGGHRRDGTVPRRHSFVWLEQLIAAHLDTLFPGLEVLEAHAFRVTRDADTAIQELEASDLLETIQESVHRRQFGHVVRLSVTDTMPSETLELLTRQLGVHRNDVYRLEAPLGLSALGSLYAIERHDLKNPHFTPAVPAILDPALRGGDIFDAIRKQDMLVHHPFDSFSPVQEFLDAAAKDPAVLAIKQTLYRVGGDSPVVGALLAARQAGKQVSVLVELKARFDEASNIGWARMLESEGAHVVYGLLGLKTHSKVALVVRREGDHIRRYVHLATGNYNPVTAQLYTDIGLFTCDPDIGADATDLFNYLTGYSAKSSWRKLLVAPVSLRPRMEQLIRREADHQRAGRQGRIVLKMNALIDQRMIQLLYEAAQAGVTVQLLIRGICGLRPGVPGVSDNISVHSIVGRFLEHSRVYYFQNGGDDEVYLGSADLMGRNLDRRVEVVFPVEDPGLVRTLRDDILEVYLSDNVNARTLGPEGEWTRLQPPEGQEAFDSQAHFLGARQGRGSLRRPAASLAG